MARTLANKLNQSRNPIKILIPLKGWSEADREGDVLFDPESSQAFLESLEKSLKSDVGVVKVDYHINDKEFSQEAADIMISMLRGSG